MVARGCQTHPLGLPLPPNVGLMRLMMRTSVAHSAYPLMRSAQSPVAHSACVLGGNTHPLGPGSARPTPRDANNPRGLSAYPRDGNTNSDAPRACPLGTHWAQDGNTHPRRAQRVHPGWEHVPSSRTARTPWMGTHTPVAHSAHFSLGKTLNPKRA